MELRLLHLAAGILPSSVEPLTLTATFFVVLQFHLLSLPARGQVDISRICTLLLSFGVFICLCEGSHISLDGLLGLRKGLLELIHSHRLEALHHAFHCGF